MSALLEERGRTVVLVLRQFMSDNHISGTAIAEAMQTRPQSVSNQLSRGKLFSVNVAEDWVEGFAKLGFQVNPIFLISGEGHITDNPEHDSFANHAFGITFKTPENSAKNESLELKRTKYENSQLKKENATLLENNKQLQDENKALKKKFFAIRRILLGID